MVIDCRHDPRHLFAPGLAFFTADGPAIASGLQQVVEFYPGGIDECLVVRRPHRRRGRTADLRLAAGLSSGLSAGRGGGRVAQEHLVDGSGRHGRSLAFALLALLKRAGRKWKKSGGKRDLRSIIKIGGFGHHIFCLVFSI